MKPLAYLMRDQFQLAYVTDDMDAAVDFFESTFGPLDFERLPANLSGLIKVDGQVADEWVIDVALANAGPTNLEIIRPVSGAVDLYRSAIRPGSAATFHHIGCRISDFDEATAILNGVGRTWKQYAEVPGVRFGYFDMTPEIGHFVEVLELGPDAAARFARLEAASKA